MRRMPFRTMHDLAPMLDRLCNEREVLPSAGIVDSQRVNAPDARKRSYDANKKLSGRKPHIAVDTDGRLLPMSLTPADIADSTSAQMVLDGLIERWPWVKQLFEDAAYNRRQLMDMAACFYFTVEAVRRSQGQQGFAVQPRRWVVGQTFAWLMRYRHLVRDYEQRIDVSENMIYMAMGSLLLYRLNFR
jgi:putative transposase